MNDAVQDIMAWEYNEMDGQQLCFCVCQLRTVALTLTDPRPISRHSVPHHFTLTPHSGPHPRAYPVIGTHPSHNS
ncbi:hypothetical protein E2C01_049974 [Portunus trituberculatus]|uniref:Uncharacterized protein n=1 Tax=Portunus trituberculatus TaxID=210409 RepID=A0A5B7GF79_PORTR|nr:hypothetical protein [Portunus trituberculatus]